jgi:hypothetical protein
MSSDMQFEVLMEQIARISADTGIQPGSLVAELSDILKLKYGGLLLEKERDLINEVRTKILTRLYNTDGHTIDLGTADANRHFRLDELEGRYLDNALGELLAEGLLAQEGRRIRLSDAGVLKYKEIYGEL